MNLRLWIPVLAALALSSCRHVPTRECTSGCEKSEEKCNNEGHSTIARRWECSKQKDKCVEACPKS